jgi:hypothetical protein
VKGEKLFRIHTGRVEVRCSLCWKKIPVGEERLTANLGSGMYPRHYHIICFLKKYHKELIILSNKIQIELNPSSRKTLESTEENDEEET